jgi:hypothetical protein
MSKVAEFSKQLDHLIDEYRDEGVGFSEIIGALDTMKHMIIQEAIDYGAQSEED